MDYFFLAYIITSFIYLLMHICLKKELITFSTIFIVLQFKLRRKIEQISNHHAPQLFVFYSWYRFLLMAVQRSSKFHIGQSKQLHKTKFLQYPAFGLTKRSLNYISITTIWMNRNLRLA